ncbi:MAG: hypothetical protein NTV29_01610 [Planctomycetota bacterium]|nr:hypothetical protein [Planctomycetota bacterium]
MRYEMNKKKIAFGTLGLFLILGCEQKPPQPLPKPITTMPSKVTIDDVKRDATASMNTTAAYSQQEKDKLLAEMKDKIAIIDANIVKLRLKGTDLASDAKANWDLKMAALDEKRKSANEKLSEMGGATSRAWPDVEAGARSAWEELSKAVQEASNEF